MTTQYQKPSHLCATRFCRHPRGVKNLLCSRCKMRQWRAANPIHATLTHLRRRAKDKKVPFDLTLPWLTAFLTETGYDSSIHHIDRKLPWLGYTMGNLQILDSSENIAKGNRERHGQAQIPF